MVDFAEQVISHCRCASVRFSLLFMLFIYSGLGFGPEDDTSKLYIAIYFSLLNTHFNLRLKYLERKVEEFQKKNKGLKSELDREWMTARAELTRITSQIDALMKERESFAKNVSNVWIVGIADTMSDAAQAKQMVIEKFEFGLFVASF